MSINYKKTVAIFEGNCEIEEAETLLSWLLDHPKGKLNLKHLEHMHTAILQVVMALQPEISAVPENDIIAAWIQPLLKSNV